MTSRGSNVSSDWAARKVAASEASPVDDMWGGRHLPGTGRTCLAKNGSGFSLDAVGAKPLCPMSGVLQGDPSLGWSWGRSCPG